MQSRVPRHSLSKKSHPQTVFLLDQCLSVDVPESFWKVRGSISFQPYRGKFFFSQRNSRIRNMEQPTRWITSRANSTRPQSDSFGIGTSCNSLYLVRPSTRYENQILQTHQLSQDPAVGIRSGQLRLTGNEGELGSETFPVLFLITPSSRKLVRTLCRRRRQRHQAPSRSIARTHQVSLPRRRLRSLALALSVRCIPKKYAHICTQSITTQTTPRTSALLQHHRLTP